MCSFLVAVTNNYLWNRLWTFRHQRGQLVHQGLRFLVVSTIALGANLLFPPDPRRARGGQDSGAGGGDRPRHSVELRGEQALELPTPLRALLPLAAAVLLGLAVASPAAAQTPTSPVYDADGNVIGAPFVPQEDTPPSRMREPQVLALALADPKIADWVDRYEGQKLTKDATFDEDTRTWDVKVWAPAPAGQIVEAKVDDATATVTEAWTGPQVAWKMARGYDGAFGKKINNPFVWLGFCAAFLIGLANFRRPLSIRNLDLLVLLSFSLSLREFNQGDVFTAMVLVYPPFLYLLGRLVWIGVRGRGSPSSPPLWPVWVLLAATVFLAGFRIGLNIQASNVIDVGYASVIGAQRIAGQGEMPYGHMPTDDGKECGPADSEGYVRERIQTNGRCESANERGDTYGPVTYMGYIPGWLLFGWTGHWDSLPAAHFTSILFDLLAIGGLLLVGRRFGGNRLGVTLAFAWAAYPFTQYMSNSNSNDAIMPVILIWGFWLLSSPFGRGGVRRPRRLGEVRLLPPLAALGLVPRGDRPRRAAPPRRLRRWACSSAPRSRSGSSCSSPTRSTRRASSGIAPSGGSSHARRRSRSGTGIATATPTSRGSRACSRSSCSSAPWRSTSCRGARARSPSRRSPARS